MVHSTLRAAQIFVEEELPLFSPVLLLLDDIAAVAVDDAVKAFDRFMVQLSQDLLVPE